MSTPESPEREPKARRGLRGQIIVSLLVLIAASVLSTKVLSGGREQTVAEPAKPVTLADCEAAPAPDYRCYADYFATETYEKGATASFTEMKAALGRDGYIKSECHQLTHIIGRTSFERTNSLEQAYAEGDNFCWSGFYHGAMEQAVSKLGAATIKADAPMLCKPFSDKKAYSFDHYNCVHGLGHGLLAIASYDLDAALVLCDNEIDGWEKESCYGGVFMENLMAASRTEGPSRYFKPDQPMYPCTAVAKPYKGQCYLMQTSYALRLNSYSFAETFRSCAKADADFRNTCYQSLGRDASGSSTNEVAGTVANCRQTTDHNALYNCMLGAARDFVSYFHGPKEALTLCDAFGGDLVKPCKDDVAAYARNL